MAFYPTEGKIIPQAIAVNSTTKLLPLGTIVRATDTTLGEGEFIYLQGVASTTVGNLVSYDVSFQTALATIALANGQPVAVAMSACVASEYGWYQIGGLATMKKANTVSFAAQAAVGAGAGLAIAAASDLRLGGSIVAVVASAKSDVTTVKVIINRPAGPAHTA
jgi:hypothetical protein